MPETNPTNARSVAAICPTCQGWVHLCDLGFDKSAERSVYLTAARISGTIRFLTDEEIRSRVVPICSRDCKRRAK